MKSKSGIVIFILSFIVLALAISVAVLVNKLNFKNKEDSLMADAFEIEKKWLIDKEKIPFDLSAAQALEIEQTYICFSPEMRVRRINGGEQYILTIKANITDDGLTRDEVEYSLTEDDYNNLITKQEGNVIHKTRYKILDSGYMLEVDIYSGALEGLACLEVEFENSEQADGFKTPGWVVKEVTGDLNYKNGHLARYGIPATFASDMNG